MRRISSAMLSSWRCLDFGLRHLRAAQHGHRHELVRIANQNRALLARSLSWRDRRSAPRSTPQSAEGSFAGPPFSGVCGSGAASTSGASLSGAAAAARRYAACLEKRPTSAGTSLRARNARRASPPGIDCSVASAAAATPASASLTSRISSSICSCARGASTPRAARRRRSTGASPRRNTSSNGV